MRLGCSIGIFLNSAHLICRSTDISTCFRGTLDFEITKVSTLKKEIAPLNASYFLCLNGILFVENAAANTIHNGTESDSK